ncbi:VOC family protein [Sinisalibacter aestuarii]|uniref:VOC domain-containing protein n=1 Tax=Sinisalibacter aestuarii TaxID=2949426 RepID=A0ABQ5LZP9_9RHOB|nr:VOC family protein [Sinisalibacter aestuarii]GKY90198.1 hypothetical protein STA1M1_40670 [Sinisalibacter aestuarii]
MIASVTLGVSDIDDAMTFYRQFMEVIGWDEKFATRRSPPGPWAGWHPLGAAGPLFILSHPDNPHSPAMPGGGAVVSFEVASPALVEAAYDEALALGGKGLRAPGRSYPATDYAASIRDPFGNALRIVCHQAD